MYRKTLFVLAVLLLAVGAVVPLGHGVGAALDPGAGTEAGSAAAAAAVQAPAGASHRLIVELESPSLASWAAGRSDPGLFVASKLQVASAPARKYLAALA